MVALFGGPVAANDNSPKPRKRNLVRENERRHANAPERTCEHCNEVFRRRSDSRNAARFCSRKCSLSAGGTSSKASDPAVSPEFRQLAATFVVAYRVALIRCGCCRKLSPAPNLLAKFCSEECRTETRNVAFWERRGVDTSPRTCPECSAVFNVEYGRGSARFCSNECSGRHSNRASKARRKARLRMVANDNVNPFDVFHRDRWKCQICGVSTPRSLRGTYDDRAPELDHVMPLSLGGGAHTYENTQCACRKCNATKSDTPPDQPSLFAYA